MDSRCLWLIWVLEWILFSVLGLRMRFISVSGLVYAVFKLVLRMSFISVFVLEYLVLNIENHFNFKGLCFFYTFLCWLDFSLFKTHPNLDKFIFPMSIYCTCDHNSCKTFVQRHYAQVKESNNEFTSIQNTNPKLYNSCRLPFNVIWRWFLSTHCVKYMSQNYVGTCTAKLTLLMDLESFSSLVWSDT